jgi:hypothetical protein
MMETSLVVQESELDRVRELTNIGAGHAATAFAQLVGRPCRMRVPTVRLLRADAAGSAFVATPWRLLRSAWRSSKTLKEPACACRDCASCCFAATSACAPVTWKYMIRKKMNRNA